MTLALDRFRQAAEIWGQENDATGLALAHYRMAEAHWRQDDAPAARTALAEASTLLETHDSPASEDRQAVTDALTAVAAIERGHHGTGDHEPWKPWRWQAYDDAFRISVLFRDQAGQDSVDTE